MQENAAIETLMMNHCMMQNDRELHSEHNPTASAMLLAAGRGERMRPLSDTCPKPLLTVHGKPLLQWHLEALLQGGFVRMVVNTAWLNDTLVQSCQNMLSFLLLQHGLLHYSKQIEVLYSQEGRDFGAALETAGGICRALPMLCPLPSAAGHDVFWVVAGDVFAPHFTFTQTSVARFVNSGKLAHLWLVPNPVHHPQGDFGLDINTELALSLMDGDVRPRYTYSTIGLYHRALFAPPWCNIEPGNPTGIRAALAPLLRAAMDHGLVSAEMYAGNWTDVGTPERLAQLNSTSTDMK